MGRSDLVTPVPTTHGDHVHLGINDGTTHGGRHLLGSDLDWDGMGRSDLVTPVPTTHGDHVHLGIDDGTTHGGRHLLGRLHAETDVSVHVTHDNEGLEAGTLTGTGLLLNRHDLH